MCAWCLCISWWPWQKTEMCLSNDHHVPFLWTQNFKVVIHVVKIFRHFMSQHFNGPKFSDFSWNSCDYLDSLGQCIFGNKKIFEEIKNSPLLWSSMSVLLMRINSAIVRNFMSIFRVTCYRTIRKSIKVNNEHHFCIKWLLFSSFMVSPYTVGHCCFCTRKPAEIQGERHFLTPCTIPTHKHKH